MTYNSKTARWIFFFYILISVIKRNVSQILFKEFEATLNFPNFKCFQISKLHQVIKSGSNNPSKSNCRKLFWATLFNQNFESTTGEWLSASDSCLMNHVEWVFWYFLFCASYTVMKCLERRAPKAKRGETKKNKKRQGKLVKSSALTKPTLAEPVGKTPGLCLP